MKNMTDITVVLDRSGSMQSCRQGVIDGFNAFVEDQRKTPGDGRWTLIQFDSQETYFPQFEMWLPRSTMHKLCYDVIFDGLLESEVPKLTAERFVPRGGTPLRDAVCRAIDETGERLAKMNEADRPDKVMMLIMTDGEENTSSIFSDEDMRKKIQHQRDVYNWRIQFVGANQDAVKVGTSYGVSRHMCMNFESTNKGTAKAYNSIASGTRDWKLDGNADAGAASLMGSAAPDDGTDLVGNQPGMNS